MRRHTLIPVLVLLAMVAAACGDEAGTGDTVAPDDAGGPFPAGAFAFSASSNLAVGAERLLVAVASPTGARLASEDIPVTVSVWPDGGSAGDPVDAQFMWAVPGSSGLYRAMVDFPTPGTWWVSVTPAGGDPLPDFPVTVHAEPFTPAIGQPAPASDSATTADAPLSEITTDHHPDPRFYEMSIAAAVTSGRPTVIVFATPLFCTTGVCGPTLDDIKAMAPSYPDVNFVHVEVFTNLSDPENLVVVAAVIEWGLPTEPWVFVVDADGIITGRFEGVVGTDEIEALLP
jgi:hypothetical protein